MKEIAVKVLVSFVTKDPLIFVVLNYYLQFTIFC